ncbi:C40 family peptidase [Bifidobacterium sp. B4107]|uniref:NlpC/P60 family protein n=1 Tax=unclassified Bifidobacterium TaxID=2608897 RepID=UPI00226B0C4E|nr:MULTISPECIES: NlpC/P60 family protein [unclassified Bifidobacterium]MCX8647143.1 C40 family peptidase [Bifidobacterium sp. B4107]MCX8651323.1 C40 family peptidase [Bifidobacterium sp. B4111]MCX8657753.1 C40 family peptidase [Bifidobacterium sp. B4114]
MADLNVLIARMRYWCDVASLGYSQSDRWDIRDGGNADCSSLVIWCLREAGFDTGGATYTGNLSAELTARGWARLPNDGNPMPGDILLNDRDHVAVYLGGGRLAQASMSEHGTAWGSGGDQTGGETNTAPYYDYPWDCYLRYTGPQDEEDDSNDDDEEDSMKAIIQLNDQQSLHYFDGSRLHQLPNADDVDALQMVAKATMGRTLPMIKLGSDQAPWGTRLAESLG